MIIDFIKNLSSQTIFPPELIESLELVITFVLLYGFIFYLLTTADNKKQLRKQK